MEAKGVISGPGGFLDDRRTDNSSLPEKRSQFYKEGFNALSYRGQGKKLSPEVRFSHQCCKNHC